MSRNIYRENTPRMKHYKHYFIAVTLVVVVISFNLLCSSPFSLLHLFNSTTNNCLVSFGEYHGHKYNSVGTLDARKCLVQSKWMQVMQHKVQLDENTVIDDWLFIDYHDRINVLVEDPNAKDKKFLILRQTKYALEGKESLAIVGGIIEPHEEAANAAKREVNEELGLDCKFKALGRFRTDVNRGMGWVNSFLAHDCQKKALSTNNSFDPSDEVGSKDVERQDVISMGVDEVMQNVKDGKFVEVQWSNTVALAMLDIKS